MVLVESSDLPGSSNGVFGINSSTGGPNFYSRGTSSRSVSSVITFPTTKILTGIGDISGDTSTVRYDGTQVATSTGDQGTGNYLAYPLYIGARAGTSLFFNGHIYSLIVRFGPNLDATQIANAERWTALRNGVTLP
jgi:hypothetical protein